MKLLTKTTCVILLAAMWACMFTSCTNKDTPNTGALKTITIWTSNAHSKSAYNQVISEWNANEGAKLGVKLVYEVKEGDISQQIDLSISTDQAPDLFSGNVKKLAADGYIMPLSELPGGTEFLNERYSRMNSNPADNAYLGKNYFVPMASTTMGLVYNMAMFKAAGIVDEEGEPTPPQTYTELREYAKRLTNPAKREYGIAIPLKWAGVFGDISNSLMSVVGHNGYDPVNDIYDYSGLKPVMEAYIGIRDDESYYPGAESLDNDPARARFAEGGIGMKMAYSFDVGVLTDQFPATIEWGVAPMPVVDKNNMYKQWQRVTGSLVINSKLTDKISPETIMEIYKFLCGDPMIKKLYASGCEVPYDWSIVEGIKLEKDVTGWSEFCKMGSISENAPISREIEISGERTLKEDFIEKVWTGAMTIEQAISNYNKVANAGVKKYQELHPDYNGDKCVNKEWNIKREKWMFD